MNSHKYCIVSLKSLLVAPSQEGGMKHLFALTEGDKYQQLELTGANLPTTKNMHDIVQVVVSGMKTRFKALLVDFNSISRPANAVVAFHVLDPDHRPEVMKS